MSAVVVDVVRLQSQGTRLGRKGEERLRKGKCLERRQLQRQFTTGEQEAELPVELRLTWPEQLPSE